MPRELKMSGAAKFKVPGVFIEETAFRPRTIEGTPTSLAAFVGCAAQGDLHRPQEIRSLLEFEQIFGGFVPDHDLWPALRLFFLNGGKRAWVVRVANHAGPTELVGDRAAGTGLHALEKLDIFNLLAVPRTARLAPSAAESVQIAALALCERRRAFLIADSPAFAPATATAEVLAWRRRAADLGSRNGALYFPPLSMPSPTDGSLRLTVAASGAVAGAIVRTDDARGVWKAPAGTDVVLHGIAGLAFPVTRQDQETLASSAINPLIVGRDAAPVVWGSRTLRATHAPADEYKYVPVRRLALFLEESLFRGLQWTAFETNAAPLWSRVQQTTEDFLHGLWQRGAFTGVTPKEAFFVRCGRGLTMTDVDIAAGTLILEIGFAPSRPAEFLILRIALKSGAGP